MSVKRERAEGSLEVSVVMSGDAVHEEAAAPCARVGRGSAMSEGALIQRAR